MIDWIGEGSLMGRIRLCMFRRTCTEIRRSIQKNGMVAKCIGYIVDGESRSN